MTASRTFMSTVTILSLLLVALGKYPLYRIFLGELLLKPGESAHATKAWLDGECVQRKNQGQER